MRMNYLKLAGMNRRSFLRNSVAVAAVPLATPPTVQAQNALDAKPFSLDYAPHFGMFKAPAGGDLVKQLEWAHAQGFRSWEDNQMANRSQDDQLRIAAAMERLNMRMGVFVCNFGTAFGKSSFTGGKKEHMNNFLADLKKSVEVSKRVNAKWMTVVLGNLQQNLRIGYQHANAIEMLRRGAEVLEPHALTMVMEPLNFRDHSGMYLERSDHAFMLCKAVQSPSVKILFDIYHQAATEGNIIQNINHCWDEIAYFQVGDNPGRKEPGTGEVNYQKVFAHIRKREFQGILGMEHGNSKGGADGAQAVITAYRAADID